MRRYFPFIFLILSACGELTVEQETRLIEDLPSAETLADSLNNLRIGNLQWSVNDGKVIYGSPTQPNWEKELAFLIKNNVNHLRFRDAFDVTDSVIGPNRTVTFRAKSDAQEIKLAKFKLHHQNIVGIEIEKSRDNFFSESHSKFVFEQNHYWMEMNQKIKWLFGSRQLVYGELLVPGELWRGTLMAGEGAVPFQFSIDKDKRTITVYNADERVIYEDNSTPGDSLTFSSTLFRSSFTFKYINDSVLSGRWINAKRDKAYQMIFTAHKNVPWRFKTETPSSINITGDHTVVLEAENPEDNETVMLRLSQLGQKLTGSLLTESGDYRFLDGVVRNDSLLLSSMDGTHAYLFAGKISGGNIQGVYRSGPTWSCQWKTSDDPSLKLRDAHEISGTNDSATVDFTFKNEYGEPVSLSDPKFSDKPIILAIGGTWCSNCMDEACFLNDLYSNKQQAGLEVIMLSFELVTDSAKALENLRRFRKSTGLKYGLLLAGTGTNRAVVNHALPFLKDFYSYPTMITLDKNHQVVDVHTGFSGPATGKAFEEFSEEYYTLIKTLLKG